MIVLFFLHLRTNFPKPRQSIDAVSPHGLAFCLFVGGLAEVDTENLDVIEAMPYDCAPFVPPGLHLCLLRLFSSACWSIIYSTPSDTSPTAVRRRQTGGFS